MAHKRSRLTTGPSGLCLVIVAGATLLCPASAAPTQIPPDPTVQQATQQGAKAMAAGDFSGAIATYTTATKLSPLFPEGYLNLGLASFQAGHIDDARAALEKALKLKPGLRGANLFLGIIAYRQNHFKNAEELFLRETRLDPHGAKAFMWLGVCRLAENDPQGAIAPLDKAYTLDPADADILYHRGHAYFLVANASYDAMFKLDHDSMRVHQVLGEAYAQAYRNSDAIKEFELAIKMSPKLPGLHEELGDQYWITGQIDKVAAEYREELEIDPNAAAAMYKLGSLLVMSQDPMEGVKLLRKALKQDPALSDAHYYLGDGLMNQGQNEEAVREFKQAIAADSANDRAMSSYYKLAQLYRKLDDKQDAQAAMQSFLKLRADRKAQQDNRVLQIEHKRTELPVEDPERASITGGSG